MRGRIDMKKICSTCGKEKYIFSWESECSRCSTERYHKEMKRQILAGERNSTDTESEIYCPYCGEIHEIDDEYDLYDDGWHETYCGSCDKAFTVVTSVSHYFDTERIEGQADE